MEVEDVDSVCSSITPTHRIARHQVIWQIIRNGAKHETIQTTASCLAREGKFSKKKCHLNPYNGN